MLKEKYISANYNSPFHVKLIFILLFLAGMLNSKQYLEYMGLSSLYNISEGLFYLLLLTMSVFTVINNLYRKSNIPVVAFKYWILLCTIVMLKLIFVFIQFPSLFLPGEKHFSQTSMLITDFLLIFILVLNIKNVKEIKKSIVFLGLGSSISVIVPILFFPEMIATRISVINGFNFYGSFWNASVIAFITVGWLLVAASNLEKLKVKKVLLTTVFFLFIFGSIAGLSRATLISVILSVTIYMIFSRNLKNYIRVVVSLIILIVFMNQFFSEIIVSFSNRLEHGINIENENRTRIWREYLKNIPDYFFFGEIHWDYRKYSTGGYGPHSVILNWFVQFGIIGLIGFLILLIGIFNNIRSISLKHSKNVVAALFAWLTAYLSVSVINETGFNQITLFASIGIIYAWGRISKRST